MALRVISSLLLLVVLATCGEETQHATPGEQSPHDPPADNINPHNASFKPYLEILGRHVAALRKVQSAATAKEAIDVIEKYEDEYAALTFSNSSYIIYPRDRSLINPSYINRYKTLILEQIMEEKRIQSDPELGPILGSVLQRLRMRVKRKMKPIGDIPSL
jgi:hypothetical protein